MLHHILDELAHLFLKRPKVGNLKKKDVLHRLWRKLLFEQVFFDFINYA